jgi:uncharacterized phage infection (PIP) family protein YhgE
MGVCQSKETIQKLKEIDDNLKKINDNFNIIIKLSSKYTENRISNRDEETEVQNIKDQFQEATQQFQDSVKHLEEFSPEKIEETVQEQVQETVQENVQEQTNEETTEILKVAENMPIYKALLDKAEEYRTVNNYKSKAYENAAKFYAAIDYPLFSERGCKEIMHRSWYGPCKGTANFVLDLIQMELHNRKKRI